MSIKDIRTEATKYYDLNPEVPDDIPFYKERILTGEVKVLELGCGTGRVLLPLAQWCGYVHGIDTSEAMLSICRERLREAAISDSKAKVQLGNISHLVLEPST